MEQSSGKLGEFKDPYFEEVQANTKFSFDFVLWFYRILKYWYLFVLSLLIFGGYAYFKNKSWTPVYRSSAVLVIEPRGSSVVQGAIKYDRMTQGTSNQIMLLTSHDMAVRTIDKLPQLQVDYFYQTQFRRINIYGQTPIVVECNFIAPGAYNYVFQVEPIDASKCRIFYEETETTPGFSREVPYDQFIQETRFFIKIKKTDLFTPNFTPFSFRFVSKPELISRYKSSLNAGEMFEGSSAVNVSVYGENSIQDVEYLRALLKEFEIYNLMLKNEAADNTIAFIDKQLLIISDSLNSSESTFRGFQEKTGLYKLETTEENRGQLNTILEALGENKAKENAVLMLTEMINNTITEGEELADPAALGLTSEGSVQLSGYISKYNALLAKMNEMGQANPLYLRNAKEMNELRINILKGLRSIQEKVQQEKESLNSTSDNIRGKMSTLPAQEREYLRYERQYKVNESYHTYLVHRRYEANIQKASNVPDNYILDEAKGGGGPINGEERSQTYMTCLLIGLVIPLVFVILKEEIFNFSIATKEDCEKISGLPVIGTIENVSKKMSGGAALVKNFPKSSFAETFRNMRVRIEYITQREYPISLLVTSAEPADGKTFIAANMASIYQLTGKRVLLLDFDLRRPSVSKNLGIHAKKGISNFLIGQVTLDEIILTHPDYGFDVIPAGTLPPNPSELIKTKKTKDLIDFLKTKYDYVIIDCSPIGLVSDAYILSKYVETSLFVVRRAKTNKSFFKSVITQVRDDGLEHFVLVFNDVKGREGYYGTSRYYGDRSYYLKRNSYYHDDYFEK